LSEPTGSEKAVFLRTDFILGC